VASSWFFILQLYIRIYNFKWINI